MYTQVGLDLASMNQSALSGSTVDLVKSGAFGRAGLRVIEKDVEVSKHTACPLH